MATMLRKRPARKRLVETASRLFYAYGVTATGIDTITAEAGVAKMSLYNNFSSKEDLVLAYINARHNELLTFYRERLGQAENPMQRVLAMFDAYIDHASMDYDDGFRGCGLLNAAAELPTGSEGREAVRLHKEQIQQHMQEHLAEAGMTEPSGAASHMALLLEGAMCRGGLDGTIAQLQLARQLAVTMLAAP